MRFGLVLLIRIVFVLSFSLPPISLEALSNKEQANQDSVLYVLSPLSVGSEPAENRQKIRSALAHGNPFIELQIRDSRFTTLVPGVGGGVFVDIPGGVQIYNGNNNFLLNLQPNAGLLSGFSGNNIELRLAKRSALRPALDEPIEMRLRAEEGIFLSLQPLELSAAIGHTTADSAFSFGLSMQHHDVPNWIPRGFRREIAFLGSGDRVHGFLETRLSGGLESSVEGYFLGHITDVSQMLGFARYRDRISQYYGTFKISGPIARDNRFQLSLNRQHGETNLSVWNDYDGAVLIDTAQGRFQNLTFNRIEAEVVGPGGESGVAFFELRRNSTIGHAKRFEGIQVFLSRQRLFASGMLRNFLLDVDTRVDIVLGRTHLSGYGSLTRQLSPSFTTSFSLGSTWDATNAETLQDNLADISPTIFIAGQRMRYGMFRGSYMRGLRVLWFSIDARNATAQHFFPGATIRGNSYRLGLDFSLEGIFSRGISFSSTIVRRNLRLYTTDRSTLVPGSPSTELKASLIYTSRRHTVMINGAWLENFPYPESRERPAIDLGEHKILSLSYSLEISRALRFSMSMANISKQLGQRNFIAAYGSQRLAMPTIFYFSLRAVAPFRRPAVR